MAFVAGFSLIAFVTLVVALNAIGFLAGFDVSKWFVVASAFIASAAAFFILQKKKISRAWLVPLFTIVAIVGSVLFASTTIDSTYDGNSYHKTAIGALKNGWNPVYQDINTFNSSDENSHKLVDYLGEDRVNDSPWADSYPKATWIFAASLYDLTGNIETGKAINLLSIITVFLLGFSLFYKKMGYKKSILIAGLTAFNPVAVAQLFGYFNDGAMGNFIIVIIILLTMIVSQRTKQLGEAGILPYVGLGLVIVFVVNMKFTGLAYAGITIACYWVYLMIVRDWKKVIVLSVTSAVAVLFALLVVGASSYVKNVSAHSNPLYPLIGENSIDIMTHNQPASYADKSGVHKFIEANLGSTANILREPSLKIGDTDFKVPFTISIDELTVLGSDPDVRQAGYGVWFGGILILSLGLAVYLLIRYAKHYKKYLPLFLLPVASVAIIALAFDNSWWARYLPQLALIPIIVLVTTLLLRKKLWSLVLIFTMLFNMLLILSLQYDYQSKYTNAINTNITIHLPCKSAEPAQVFGLGFLSGAMYNVWDRCENIKLLNSNEFKADHVDKATRLVTDIYLAPARSR